MNGSFIDNIWFKFRTLPKDLSEETFFLDTDYGKIHVLDTKEAKPVIINVPDGPNNISHQKELIQQLSQNFRVVCFEYPGVGFSYPNARYNYGLDHGAKLLLQVMGLLEIDKAALLFSCSNGFYAIKAAELNPNRFTHLFLSQTPSTFAMNEWTHDAIPNALKQPIIGQIANIINAKKFARIWYKYALPKGSDLSNYQNHALNALNKGGCFCLSGLVQGLTKDFDKPLIMAAVPTSLVWGSKDFTHQKTKSESIKEHIEHCEIIEFPECGHFPELENTSKYIQLIRERIQ